jgi:Leucine-rich repeat (LRR) protein
MLANPQNSFCLLTELYLYINKIRKLPHLAFPNLRILNLNRNPDLLGLQLGFCPMLEQISVSYCCLQELGALKGCPNLLDIDVSFNHLASLKRFLDCLPHRNLTSLSYNDNNFTAITDGEAMYVHNATSTLQQYPEQYATLIKMNFPYIEKFGGDYIKTGQRPPSLSNIFLYRAYMNRVLS